MDGKFTRELAAQGGFPVLASGGVGSRDHLRALAAIPGVTHEQANALVHAGLTRIEDLLSAEAGDIADIPEIGEKAAEVLQAAKAEADRRDPSAGGVPVNP